MQEVGRFCRSNRGSIERSDMKTLADLESGQKGIILELQISSELMQRLASMGVLPGVEISIIKRAPLGDPLLLRFEGQEISLRRLDAAGIVLEEAI